MHVEAFEYVSKFRTDEPLAVLDIGGRDVNGTCRPLFPNAKYLAVDVRPGPGVDVMADAATWKTKLRFDVVLCTEVFEHTSLWPQLCATAYRLLRQKGRFVVTCAGPGRAPHSAIDGGAIRDGEWYENVTPEQLAAELDELGFADIDVRLQGEDLQGTAVKRL